MEQVIKVWLLGRPKKAAAKESPKQRKNETASRDRDDESRDRDDEHALLLPGSHAPLAPLPLRTLLGICLLGIVWKSCGASGSRLGLAIYVSNGTYERPYEYEEWEWDNISRLHRLWGEFGQTIQVYCWVSSYGGSCGTRITVKPDAINRDGRDCRYNFTLLQPVTVACQGQDESFTFRIDIRRLTTPIPDTTTTPGWGKDGADSTSPQV